MRSANGRSGRGRSSRIVFSALRDVKRALTAAGYLTGDVASDVAFQNDVNALLATVAGLSPLGPPPPDLPRAVPRQELLGAPLRRPRPSRGGRGTL